MIYAAVGAVDGEPGERGQEPVDFQYLLQITDQIRGKETVQGEKKPWPLLTRRKGNWSSKVIFRIGSF